MGLQLNSSQVSAHSCQAEHTLLLRSMTIQEWKCPFRHLALLICDDKSKQVVQTIFTGQSVFDSFFFYAFCSKLIFLWCLIFAVEDPFLVVVRDSIIYGISLNPDDKSNDAMVPVAGLQNGYDVDFDDNEQIIYWVEHPVWYFLKMLL